MPGIRQEVDVAATAAEVFAAAVDFGGYREWLATSADFHGINEVSTDPVQLGTTWVERGSGGVRHGTVTRFEPPTLVTFHQPMTMQPGFLGVMDITVTLTIRPGDGSVHLTRSAVLAIPWQLKAVAPLIVRRTTAESLRTVLALKATAEARHRP